MSKKKRNKPKRGRTLWLKIRLGRPPGSDPIEAWRLLRESVTDGDGELPDGYRAVIAWKNKADAEWRTDEFGSAIVASRSSSVGFDKAVIRYIDGEIAKRR